MFVWPNTSFIIVIGLSYRLQTHFPPYLLSSITLHISDPSGEVCSSFWVFLMCPLDLLRRKSSSWFCHHWKECNCSFHPLTHWLLSDRGWKDGWGGFQDCKLQLPCKIWWYWSHVWFISQSFHGCQFCQEAHCSAEHYANSQRCESENTGTAPGNKLARALLKNNIFFLRGNVAQWPQKMLNRFQCKI